jgi:3-isopropylmalate/(R)-2-methylmalate dehydratase small subunit
LIIKGKVGAKYGDNISTDEISSSRDSKRLGSNNPGDIALIPIDPEFPQKIKERTILVVGDNFGCGSSRESAPQAIKAAGAELIISASFARIFFRNAINIGLPIIECPDIIPHLEVEDIVQVDLESGKIENVTKEHTFQGSKLEPFMFEIIKRGGLIP